AGPAVEARLREMIGARFPRDAVLGEEAGLQAGEDGGRTWVIDPIDGTKNFAARIQIWATLIALCVEGRPVIGVASAPALGERYEATVGGGARLNGSPIHVSGVAGVADALICSTGMHSFIGTPWEGSF